MLLDLCFSACINQAVGGGGGGIPPLLILPPSHLNPLEAKLGKQLGILKTIELVESNLEIYH